VWRSGCLITSFQPRSSVLQQRGAFKCILNKTVNSDSTVQLEKYSCIASAIVAMAPEEDSCSSFSLLDTLLAKLDRTWKDTRALPSTPLSSARALIKFIPPQSTSPQSTIFSHFRLCPHLQQHLSRCVRTQDSQQWQLSLAYP
jgi:hypothetical protein